MPKTWRPDFFHGASMSGAALPFEPGAVGRGRACEGTLRRYGAYGAGRPRPASPVACGAGPACCERAGFSCSFSSAGGSCSSSSASSSSGRRVGHGSAGRVRRGPGPAHLPGQRAGAGPRGSPRGRRSCRPNPLGTQFAQSVRQRAPFCYSLGSAHAPGSALGFETCCGCGGLEVLARGAASTACVVLAAMSCRVGLLGEGRDGIHR